MRGGAGRIRVSLSRHARTTSGREEREPSSCDGRGEKEEKREHAAPCRCGRSIPLYFTILSPSLHAQILHRGKREKGRNRGGSAVNAPKGGGGRRKGERNVEPAELLSYPSIIYSTPAGKSVGEGSASTPRKHGKKEEGERPVSLSLPLLPLLLH